MSCPQLQFCCITTNNAWIIIASAGARQPTQKNTRTPKRIIQCLCALHVCKLTPRLAARYMTTHFMPTGWGTSYIQWCLLLHTVARPFTSSWVIKLARIVQLSERVLDTLDLRYTFPRIHWFAELGKKPGSSRHRGNASDTVCSQARLCQAAQCIEMHLGGYVYSHGE